MVPTDHNSAAKAAEALMFQQKTAGLGCSNVHFPIAPNYNTQGTPTVQNIQLQVQRNMFFSFPQFILLPVIFTLKSQKALYSHITLPDAIQSHYFT